MTPTPVSDTAGSGTPRIIWHFGFFKTATTFAQLLMRRNMATLEKHVSLFPKHVHTLELRRASQAYLRSRNEATRRVVDAKVAEIVNKVAADDKGTAIVSDETLCVFNHPAGFIDNLEHLLEVIETAARPARSEFFFYTRDMKKWLQSWHNQSVKSGQCAQEFGPWEEAITFDKNWDSIHARLSAASRAPVTFVALEDELARGTAAGKQLLRYANIPEDSIGKLLIPPRRNESLSPGALKFMISLNRSDLREPAKRQVRRLVMATPDAFS